MALRMVTDTEVSFHRSTEVRLGRCAVPITHPHVFSASPCFSPVNTYIATYFTSILDVFSSPCPPRRAAQLCCSGMAACLSPWGTGGSPALRLETPLPRELCSPSQPPRRATQRSGTRDKEGQIGGYKTVTGMLSTAQTMWSITLW